MSTEDKKEKKDFIKYINRQTVMWFVYFGILAVLLPHTARIFAKFEPVDQMGKFSSYSLAFAFEAIIGMGTHGLSMQIGRVKSRKAGWWALFKARYLNAYGYVLIISTTISFVANVTHAFQYGINADIAILSYLEHSPILWWVVFSLYTIGFGGILPICSALFARIVVDISDDEAVFTSEKKMLGDLKRQFKKLTAKLTGLENANTKLKQLLGTAEQELQELNAKIASGERREQELVVEVNRLTERLNSGDSWLNDLIAGSKTDKIKAVHRLWPEMPQRTIAELANSSVGHVNGVLKKNNGSK